MLLYRPIVPGFSQRDGRLRASRMPMVLAGMITSTNSSQGIPPFTSTWTTDRCRGMRILAGKPWLVDGLIGMPQSQPSVRQEGVPAGALPLAEPQQHARCNHRQVGQLRKLCQAGVRRSFIPVARRVRRLLCGRVAVVRLDESDRNARLHPLGTSLGYKPSGAVLRCESTTGHRILNSDVFAHSSRVMPRWDCGYARKGKCAAVACGGQGAPSSGPELERESRRSTRFYFEGAWILEQDPYRSSITAAF